MGHKHLIAPADAVVLNRLVKPFAQTDQQRLYIISCLIGREVATSKQVTRREWEGIRAAAYPLRADDNWSVSPQFRRKLLGLHNQFVAQFSFFSKDEN